MAWPWMKGTKFDGPNAFLDPPIDPVNEFDDRPSVADLIAEHRSYIDRVREQLQDENPLFSNEKHDELWILRFLMSHKNNVKAASKAAIHTLDFRNEHKLDEKDLRRFVVGPELAQINTWFSGRQSFHVNAANAKIWEKY